MSIQKHCLPGMRLAYQITYLTDEGVIRARTEWIRCEEANLDKQTVTGVNLNTGEPVTVSIQLVHTAANPAETV